MSKDIELTLASRRLQKQEASLVSLDEILKFASLDPVSKSFFFNKRKRVELSILQTRGILNSLGANTSQMDLIKEKPKAR